MSTEPDPQIVREIAREATQRAARRRDYIGSVLLEHAVMDTILTSGDRSAYRRWCNAIKAEMQTAAITVSWPDAQLLCSAQHADGGHRCLLEPGHDGRHAVRTDWGTIEWEDGQVQDGIDPYHSDMPDDDEFIDVMSGASSMYAEVTAFQRLVATVGVEQAYRKWSELLRRSERAEYQEEIDRLIGELAKAEQTQAERNTNTQTVPAGHGPGVPGAMHLEAFGQSIADAFGTCPYHVGSSATSKTWRDVDVRLILDDDRFHALFPGFAAANHIDAFWSLLCAALSELGRVRTGLPIDFQIQSMTEANAKYPGIRNPLFLIHARDEHRPTMTAPAVTAPREHKQTRTPEQWCALYGVEIHNPDGWRHADAPAWDEPITLADFYTRAQESTVRNCATVDWNRIARDVKASDREVAQ